VSLEQLELTAFRSFAHVRFEPEPQGTTVIAGPNGSGKTTLLEAVAYLGTQRSFRGAPREVMIKTGDDRAVVRASLTGATTTSWSKPSSSPPAGRASRSTGNPPATAAPSPSGPGHRLFA